MRFIKFAALAAPLFFAAKLTSALYAQAPPSQPPQVPENAVPKVGEAYVCEGTWREAHSGKDYPALFRVSRPYEGVVTVEHGIKHAHPFKTLEESWPYATGVVLFGVSGAAFDPDTDPGDYFYYPKTGKVVGWNAEKKATDVSGDEKKLATDVLSQLKTCNR